MSETVRLTVAVDHKVRTLIFKVHGRIDSARLTDLIIAAYQEHQAHWTYRRIFDYRRASGLYDFAEVERLLDWWRDAARDGAICHHVAVLSGDVLFDFRARVFDDRYDNGEIRSFKVLSEAMDWLDRVAPVRA